MNVNFGGVRNFADIIKYLKCEKYHALSMCSQMELYNGYIAGKD